MKTNQAQTASQDLPQSREERHKGSVIWFNSQKGFGFIRPENRQVNGGKDLFVHFHYLVQRGFKSLKQHDIVEFTVGSNKGGACAMDVKFIQEAPAETKEASS